MNSLKPCGENTSGGQPDKEMAENVQKEFVQLVMIGTFSDFMTAVIPTIFIGPVIDRVGRSVPADFFFFPEPFGRRTGMGGWVGEIEILVGGGGERERGCLSPSQLLWLYPGDRLFIISQK